MEPDDTALDRLLHFAKTAMSDAMPNIGTRLIEVVQKRLTGGVVVMGGRNSGFQHQQQILSAGTSSTASSYNPLATPLSNTSNTSSNFSFTSPSRQRRSVNLEECPSSILPRNMAFLLGRSATEASAAAAVILEFDPLEIARQLTLMENRIFNAIETRELMDQEWGRAKKNSVAVNVRKMSQISTQVILNGEEDFGWVLLGLMGFIN